MKKVLIIEDERPILDLLKELLSGVLEVVTAVSVEEAREKFAANPDIVAIAVDGSIEGFSASSELPNTPVLVTEFRRTFTGPIIAISNRQEFQELLMAAGCDHQCEKGRVHKKFRELLGV